MRPGRDALLRAGARTSTGRGLPWHIHLTDCTVVSEPVLYTFQVVAKRVLEAMTLVRGFGSEMKRREFVGISALSALQLYVSGCSFAKPDQKEQKRQAPISGPGKPKPISAGEAGLGPLLPGEGLLDLPKGFRYVELSGLPDGFATAVICCPTELGGVVYKAPRLPADQAAGSRASTAANGPIATRA